MFLVYTFCSSCCLPLFLDSSYSEVSSMMITLSQIYPSLGLYFQECQWKHVRWTKENIPKNNCHFDVKKTVQIMQNTILKKSSAFYWAQSCKTIDSYQNFVVKTWGEEKRVGRGSCFLWVLASHPEGWLASQIVLLARLTKGQFQEITRHDTSSWMGRCKKWARKMWCTEFWEGWFKVRGRRHRSGCKCHRRILLSCGSLSHHPRQLLPLLHRLFAGSYYFWQGIWDCLSSSLSLALPVLGLFKFSSPEISHYETLFSVPTVAPMCLPSF